MVPERCSPMAVHTYRFGITGSTICDGCSVSW